jgi:predicted RecA/RadA family phage recombinase
MAALGAERSISRKGGESAGTPPIVTVGVKTNFKIWKGALVVIDTGTGWAVPGKNDAATYITIGVALKTVDATGITSGVLTVDCARGIFPFINKGGDLIVQADMGKKVYIEDDQTAAHTAGTLSTMGVFMGFDENSNPLVQVGNLSSTGV